MFGGIEKLLSWGGGNNKENGKKPENLPMEIKKPLSDTEKKILLEKNEEISQKIDELNKGMKFLNITENQLKDKLTKDELELIKIENNKGN